MQCAMHLAHRKEIPVAYSCLWTLGMMHASCSSPVSVCTVLLLNTEVIGKDCTLSSVLVLLLFAVSSRSSHRSASGPH